jgi:hypothetical protein
MRLPHGPLPALSGECTDRRREHCAPDGNRKQPRPVSSSSPEVLSPSSSSSSPSSSSSNAAFLRLRFVLNPFPSVRNFCVYPWLCHLYLRPHPVRSGFLRLPVAEPLRLRWCGTSRQTRASLVSTRVGIFCDAGVWCLW